MSLSPTLLLQLVGLAKIDDEQANYCYMTYGHLWSLDGFS